jgi:hypothetical protein
LESRFGGILPYRQNEGTAFAVSLTLALAPPTANPVFYGRPRPGSKRLLESWGVTYVPGEMFVDFVAGDLFGPSDLRMLVGCESEMHENHGVGYSLDEDNGYAKDFRQLLRFPASVLLFAAMIRTARMAELEESLAQCARDFHGDWSAKRLYIVLLPSAKTRRRLTRLGVGEPDGSLRFEALDELSDAPAVAEKYATGLR